MRDLMFFMSFISIFVCLFGVTTQGTLYPGNKLSFSLIKSIFNKAYWPIYGEMQILNELDDCDDSLETCPETSGVAFSFIFLMIYMVIANVLLINLLIAMFRQTKAYAWVYIELTLNLKFFLISRIKAQLFKMFRIVLIKFGSFKDTGSFLSTTTRPYCRHPSTFWPTFSRSYSIS